MRRLTATERLAAALALALLAPAAAPAHEVRPGYLELRELDARTWDVLFKVPARGELRLALAPRLPAGCRGSEPAVRLAGGAIVARWRATCEAPLEGEAVLVEGLAATRTDVLARVERADGSTQTARLTPGAPSFAVAAAASPLEVAGTYLGLGVEHILLGIDHLLFVLALVFLVGGWRRLVGTVTAFTLAHSVTLAAAALGFLRVAQAPVEAAIALSIVFVAAEVLRGRRGHPGLAARKPWLVAFAFGLLHGLGFAGALREVGMPAHAVPLALALFNVGVELGQLLFLAAVFAALRALLPAARRLAGIGALDPFAVARLFALPAAYAIGSVAAFWVIERAAGFFAS